MPNLWRKLLSWTLLIEHTSDFLTGKGQHKSMGPNKKLKQFIKSSLSICPILLTSDMLQREIYLPNFNLSLKFPCSYPWCGKYRSSIAVSGKRETNRYKNKIPSLKKISSYKEGQEKLNLRILVSANNVYGLFNAVSLGTKNIVSQNR